MRTITKILLIGVIGLFLLSSCGRGEKLSYPKKKTLKCG